MRCTAAACPHRRELLATDADTLRGIGLSRAKAVYLHDLAARMEDGRLDLERLRTLDDDAARAELTQVKGVGRFTAEGVLMLALRRQDVWPAADLALRRAVERVWGLDRPGVGRGRRRHRRAVPTVADARRGLPLPHQGGIARTSTGRRSVPSAWTRPPCIAAPCAPESDSSWCWSCSARAGSTAARPPQARTRHPSAFRPSACSCARRPAGMRPIVPWCASSRHVPFSPSRASPSPTFRRRPATARTRRCNAAAPAARCSYCSRNATSTTSIASRRGRARSGSTRPRPGATAGAARS